MSKKEEIKNEEVKEEKFETTETNDNIKNELEVIAGSPILVQEKSNDKYNVYQLTDGENKGKFVRKIKYQEHSSIETSDTKSKLMILEMMEDEKITVPIGEAIGQVLTIGDVIIKPYDKLNEDTGQLEYGALTYIFEPDMKNVYVTSSKTFMMKLLDTLKIYGGIKHYEEDEALKIVPIKKKVDGTKNAVTTFKIKFD